MSGLLYRALRLFGSPFRYRCIGSENIRDGGPAIYAGNHLGGLGPIQAILSLPLRLYPWVIAEMADYGRAPSYLYDDFVHPTWRLRGRFGRVAAAIVSRFSVTLIKGLGCVAVDRNRGQVIGGFRASLALLLGGRNLLIFPEDPQGPLDAETRMRPFLSGFLWLGCKYERATGRQLPVYPLAVSDHCRTVSVGRPIFFDDRGDRRRDVRRVCDQLEGQVRELLG